jgi:hypothetical protein
MAAASGYAAAGYEHAFLLRGRQLELNIGLPTRLRVDRAAEASVLTRLEKQARHRFT